MLNRDIFRIDPADLDKVKVAMTVVDGRVVYEAKKGSWESVTCGLPAKEPQW